MLTVPRGGKDGVDLVHLIRTGQILLADKGFAGKQFKQLTDAMGLRLLRPDRKDETETVQIWGRSSTREGSAMRRARPGRCGG
jgi:hypothetical protein